MKIYSKVVIDMATGHVDEEVSTDYEGKVALAKGGSSAPAAVAPVAKRPERVVEVTPEEIKLGGQSTDNSTAGLRKGGKRSLSRPTGSTSSTGLSV